MATDPTLQHRPGAPRALPVTEDPLVTAPGFSPPGPSERNPARATPAQIVDLCERAW